MKNRLLILLLIVSIGFGFLKQFKTAFNSITAMRSTHEEPGGDARVLRDALYKWVKEHRTSKKFQVAYVSDRRDNTAQRPAREYFYNAQYGFAPEILITREQNADFTLFDFNNREEGENACRARQLNILATRGNLVLASAPAS